MKPDSYPSIPVSAWGTVNVRPLLPIYTPPEPLDRPALPTKQRTPSFDSPYILSTHIIPACYLRTGRFAPMPPPPPNNMSKEERTHILDTYMYDLRVERGTMSTDGYPQVLWNCANRYVHKGLRSRNRTGLTLFFAHANGFPKEIWEPTLASLLSSPANLIIDEIWCWEAIQHGDAALINNGSLSKYFDWQDNTRDILSFFTNFLPSEPDSTPLPLHLHYVSADESARRRESGFQHRRLMIVGHSYGGCTSTLATEIYPQLVDSLVLIDPVIPRPHTSPEIFRMSEAKTNGLLLGSLTRRGTWKTREEVLSSYSKNPFFTAWDPAVLKIYIEAGMYDTTDDDGNPLVKLKMPGIYESVVFAERVTGSEAWDGLPNIPERIPIRWLVPDRKDADEFGPPGVTQERVWLRPKNASNFKVPGAGHLIAQERPLELAEDLRDFIFDKYANLSRQRSAAPPRANL